MKLNHAMKHPFVPLLAAAALVACTGTDQGSQATQDAPTADEVAQQAEEAMDTTAQYVDAQMAKYRSQMREQFTALETRLDSMQEKVAARSGELEAGTKAQWNETMSSLRQQAQQFEQRLDEATANSNEAMGEVQRGLDKAWTDLKASVQQAEAEFREGSGEDS